jgi:streptogramin lyase
MLINPLIMKKILLFCAIFFITVSSFSQTNVSGVISTNTTWTLANSPYNIIGNVGLSAGVTLTIDEGVVVNYKGDFQILVLGNILVNGSSSNRIKFNGFSSNVTQMLLFKSVNLSLSSVNFVDFAGPQSAIQLANESEQDQDQIKNTGILTVDNSTFSNSGIYTKGYQTTAGFLVKNSTFSSCTIKGYYPMSEPITIDNCAIVNSAINSDSYNLGIKVLSSVIKSSNLYMGCCGSNFDIQNSVVYSSPTVEGGGNPVSGNFKIQNSKFINSPINLPSANLSILNSIIQNNSPISIYFGNGIIENSSLLGDNMQNAIIISGRYGYNIGGTTTIKGTLLSNFNRSLVFEGVNTVNINSNNFLKIDKYAVENLSSYAINAINNYWGTTIISDIEKLIYDSVDDLNKGTVTYVPILTTPNITAPIAPPINFIKSKSGTGVVLTWTANAESDVKGYKLYNGNPTGYSYSTVVDLGNVTTYTVPNGDITTEYALTAYDVNADGTNDQVEGFESWYTVAKEPKVTLSYSKETIEEDLGTSDIVATLNYTSPVNTTIKLLFTGTAEKGVDYAISSETITIPAGFLSASVKTTAIQDEKIEPQETIIVNVESIVNASMIGTTTLMLKLNSDDNPSFTMTSPNTSMAEHESLDITATLQAATSKDVTINLDISGTAKFDVDYTANYIGKGTASTVAGGNGSGSAANQLSNPSDIFVDQAGTIYVLDSANRRIQKWEKGATSATTVVTLPTWVNYFFIDSENSIYISDSMNGRIQKWSVGSPTWTTVAGGNGGGNNANQLSSPSGICVDTEGSIYIADSMNNRVQKWLKNAIAGTTVAGGNGQGSATNQLSSPSSIFVDLSGNIFISDSGNRRVQKWDKGASLGATLFSPVDVGDNGYIPKITGNTNGTIYILYLLYSLDRVKIKKWSPEASTLIEVYQSESGMYAQGFFVDNSSNIYLADRGNNRIQKIQMATQITIKAGETVGKLTIKGIEDDLDNEGTETIIVKATSAVNADVTNVLDITISLLDNTKSFTLQSSPFPGLANGSVAWGDYDRDGDLDVAIMGSSPTLGAVTALYENQNGVFVNTNQNFQKLYDGDISWIDINKDGWIDLVVSGYSDKPYTKLYINKQGNYFEPTDDYGLPQLYATTMAWGDLDNDGDIDLAIAGLDASDTYIFSIYYREDGKNKFVKETSSVSGMYYISDPGFIKGDMKIVDVDLDGDNDLVYNGENASGSTIGGVIMNTLINPNASNPYTTTPYGQSSTLQLKNSTIEIAKFKNHNGITILSSGVDNTGKNVFFSSNMLAGTAGAGTESQYPKLKNGDIAVADYNIDGLNDIIFTGENQEGVPVTKLYIQDSNGNFKESPIELQGLRNSTTTWVDYDMDGDLDLFLTGEDNTGSKTILYKSEIANKKNASPAKITGLKAEDKGYGTVRFSWDKPVDDFSTDLSYVLRLGTTPGGTELSNTESDLLTGRRLIAKAGQIYTNFFEIQLDPGVYYWSVQAVDTGSRGGIFSDETSVTLTYDWKMLNQGGIVDRRINGQSNPTIKLADLDNDNRLDLIYGSSSGNTQAYRFDGKRLININNSNLSFFGGTSGIENGDVNGDGTTDILMTAGASTPYKFNIYLSDGQGGYTVKDLGAGLYKAKVKTVDLNNDGSAEIVLMGLSSSQSSGRLKLYIYEYVKASQSFITTEITNISALSEASFDLGDVDKDGDVDFILSGFNPSSGLQSFIYTNDTPLGGTYTFTQTSNNLVGVIKGTSNLIDFDGDGDLDAVFTGTSASGDVFEIYINKINEGISTWPRLNNLGLNPMREGKIDLGDFNGDGYADLLYSGILDSGIGQATRLSEFNPSTQRYNNSSFDVSDIIKAEVEFGDLDGDGDLDFSLSGESKTAPGTYIFRTYINFRNESAKVVAQQGSGKSSNKGSNTATFVVNEPPTVPILNTVKNIEGGVYNSKGLPLEFSWIASDDDHTPVNGLTYAIKIGTTPGGEQIMSSNANASGVRKSSEKGNVEHNLQWKLRLPEGTYYWSVQAIDASYTGSPFTEPVKFEIVNKVLGLPSFEVKEEVVVYPNPSTDVIHIVVPEKYTLNHIDIYNYLGQSMGRYFKNTISIENLATGSYILKVHTNEGVLISRVLKN